MNNKKIVQILDKEVNRQDFLKMTGVLLLGIIGLPQLLSLLTRSFDTAPDRKAQPSGYGSSPYGK